MGQHWRFHIRGPQRKEVNKGLLIQALIELGQQLAAKQSPAATSPTEDGSLPPAPADTTEPRS